MPKIKNDSNNIKKLAESNVEVINDLIHEAECLNESILVCMHYPSKQEYLSNLTEINRLLFKAIKDLVLNINELNELKDKKFN